MPPSNCDVWVEDTGAGYYRVGCQTCGVMVSEYAISERLANLVADLHASMGAEEVREPAVG